MFGECLDASAAVQGGGEGAITYAHRTSFGTLGENILKPSLLEGQAQPSQMKKKETIGGDPKICVLILGQVDEASLEEK